MDKCLILLHVFQIGKGRKEKKKIQIISTKYCGKERESIFR